MPKLMKLSKETKKRLKEHGMDLNKKVEYSLGDKLWFRRPLKEIIETLPYGSLVEPNAILRKAMVIIDVNKFETIKQTEEICLTAVKIDGKQLGWVVDRTPAICWAAIKQNGTAIRYVDIQISGYTKMCEDAVRQNGLALQYIREMQTHKMALLAVSQNVDALEYVVDQNVEFCMSVVKVNGLALKHIRNQTFEICDAAVSQNVMALKYVKSPYFEMINERIVNKALSSKSHASGTFKPEHGADPVESNKTDANLAKPEDANLAKPEDAKSCDGCPCKQACQDTSNMTLAFGADSSLRLSEIMSIYLEGMGMYYAPAEDVSVADAVKTTTALEQSVSTCNSTETKEEIAELRKSCTNKDCGHKSENNLSSTFMLPSTLFADNDSVSGNMCKSRKPILPTKTGLLESFKSIPHIDYASLYNHNKTTRPIRADEFGIIGASADSLGIYLDASDIPMQPTPFKEYVDFIKDVDTTGLIRKYLLGFDNTEFPTDHVDYEVTIKEAVRVVSEDGNRIRFLFIKPEEVCLAAVNENGLALRYIDEQTDDMCEDAVKQSGNALKYVHEEFKTFEVCMMAIMENENALEYVENQTPEMCMVAVKLNPYVLEYVKNQTPEICLAAVKIKGQALQYVREQTPTICFAAIEQTMYATRYVEIELPKMNESFKYRVYKHPTNKKYDFIGSLVVPIGAAIEDCLKKSEDELAETLTGGGDVDLKHVANKKYDFNSVLAALPKDTSTMNANDRELSNKLIAIVTNYSKRIETHENVSTTPSKNLKMFKDSFMQTIVAAYDTYIAELHEQMCGGLEPYNIIDFLKNETFTSERLESVRNMFPASIHLINHPFIVAISNSYKNYLGANTISKDWHPVCLNEFVDTCEYKIYSIDIAVVLEKGDYILLKDKSIYIDKLLNCRGDNSVAFIVDSVNMKSKSVGVGSVEIPFDDIQQIIGSQEMSNNIKKAAKVTEVDKHKRKKPKHRRVSNRAEQVIIKEPTKMDLSLKIFEDPFIQEIITMYDRYIDNKHIAMRSGYIPLAIDEFVLSAAFTEYALSADLASAFISKISLLRHPFIVAITKAYQHYLSYPMIVTRPLQVGVFVRTRRYKQFSTDFNNILDGGDCVALDESSEYVRILELLNYDVSRIYVNSVDSASKLAMIKGYTVPFNDIKAIVG